MVAYGVIGNTADFDSVILGSSPSRPTNINRYFELILEVAIFFYQCYRRETKIKTKL